MKNVKRIMAIVGIVLLVLMYVMTLVFAIFDSSASHGMFWASVACTIIVPVFIAAIKIVENVLKLYSKDIYSDPTEDSAEESKEVTADTDQESDKA